MAIAAIGLIAWGALRTGSLLGQVRHGMLWGLFSIITGLLTYIYIMFELPGSQWALETPLHWGVLLLTVVGSLTGWGLMVLLKYLDSRQK
jgi:hypothetical protein